MQLCDKCGRKLTRGRVLWAARVQTMAERLGIYGKTCAAKVAYARAVHGMATYNADGLELDAAGRIVRGQPRD